MSPFIPSAAIDIAVMQAQDWAQQSRWPPDRTLDLLDGTLGRGPQSAGVSKVSVAGRQYVMHAALSSPSAIAIAPRNTPLAS